MVRLRMRLLGGFEARLASGALVNLPTKKARALLAYLGVRPGEAHPRDKLAALLWSETSDRQARDSLRQVLAALRRALALPSDHPTLLRLDGKTVALDPTAVEVDVATFESRAATATSQALEDAAGLYRGDLLLGFDLAEPLFEDWLVTERERLREMALEALARLLALQVQTTNAERAIRTALQLLGLDPLQEAVHRTLMRLYARQGRRGAALRQYQLCVAALERELGTQPEAETRALYQELLRRSGDALPTAEARVKPRSRARSAGRVAPDLPATETPLFGREADLAPLRQRLRAARRGAGHVAIVLGEAGIGKTRLVGTLVAEAVSEGFHVLMGHCHESDSILPFAPWVDACRGARLDANDEVLGALHPARRAELSRLLPEVTQSDLPPPSGSPLPLFESVAELLERVAARQPLLLVLEDMHWADDMSLRLLAFVNRRLAGWPTLLVVTARDDELAHGTPARRALAELAGLPSVTPVRLAPLSRADVAQIVRALARVGSDEATLSRLEERIWAMSEGNPLVAVEAMLALAPARRGQNAREDPSELPLPQRVRELVARRLDRLGARSQSMAAVASVIGRRFDFALLRSASGVDELEAAEAVEEMVRSHVLRSVRHQLEFTHDRVRDVVYDRLLPPRRRMLHAAVAKALEATVATETPLVSDPDERIEQLAYHAVRGELWDMAAASLRQAAAKAVARSALQSARTALEQALGILATLPESRSTWERAFETRLALRPVLIQLGELRPVLTLLHEAESLAERLDDEGRRGQVYAFMTNIHSRLEELEAALATGTRALGIARHLGDKRLHILATTYLEQAHAYRGDYARVIELATDNLATLPAEWIHEFFGGSQPPSINDRFRLLVSLAHLGRFAEAVDYEPETIRLAQATGHAYTVGMAYYAAATLRLIKGEWAQAHNLIERQIGVLRAGNVVGELPTALAYSARALAYLGEAPAALTRCRDAERLLEDRSARGRAANGWISYSLGSAHLVLGRLDDARRLARNAVESAGQRTDFLPDALRLTGDVAVHPDGLDTGRAETSYAGALALAQDRGMRPLIAHCHLGLGRLHRTRGDEPAARAALDTAAAMYLEMDMGFWRRQATAETRERMA